MSIESGRLYVVLQTLLIENKASKRVVYIQTKQEGDGTVPYPSVSHHTCALDVVTLENAKKKKKSGRDSSSSPLNSKKCNGLLTDQLSTH